MKQNTARAQTSAQCSSIVPLSESLCAPAYRSGPGSLWQQRLIEPADMIGHYSEVLHLLQL